MSKEEEERRSLYPARAKREEEKEKVSFGSPSFLPFLFPFLLESRGGDLGDGWTYFVSHGHSHIVGVVAGGGSGAGHRPRGKKEGGGGGGRGWELLTRERRETRVRRRSPVLFSFYCLFFVWDGPYSLLRWRSRLRRIFGGKVC